MTLKLFGHDPSPFVRRVRVLMTELGIPFERDANAWMTPTAEFDAASPIQRLPMLDRGEGAKVRWVYDSRVIAEVAYELGTTPIAAAPPLPPIQRTLWDASLEEEDKNVFSIIDASLESAVNRFLLVKDGVLPAQSAYLARQETRIERCLSWLDRRYEGRSTLVEGRLAFVDIALVSALGWYRFRQRADVDRFPNLAAVERAHAARASFASTKPG